MTKRNTSPVPAVKPLHIGISLVKSIGGQGESVRHFHEALGGAVVSFTHQDRIRREASYVADTIQVPVPDGVIAKLAMIPSRSALDAAETAAGKSNLLVVNSMYRYHVHWAYGMARRLKLPVWLVLHGALDPYVLSYRSLQKKVWLDVWGKAFLRRADRVIFATEREREKAAPVHAGGNTRVISWPVELADMTKATASRSWIRERFNLPPGKRILLFLGRYERMKRPLETIQAFAEAQCSHTSLLLAGIEEGYSTEQLREHARVLGVEHGVRVSGPIYDADKERLLLGADGFISLSWRENFGYTTAEAMAAATPVILSPGNDLRSAMDAVDCGWMLDDFSLETASRAIREFDAVGPEMLKSRGAAARHWAEHNLGFETFRHRLLNEWRSCCGSHDGTIRAERTT